MSRDCSRVGKTRRKICTIRNDDDDDDDAKNGNVTAAIMGGAFVENGLALNAFDT